MLSVNDEVTVVVTKSNISGLNYVKILNDSDSNYDCILIVRKRNYLFYEGITVKARVIRIHNNFVDLVPAEETKKYLL